MRFLADWMLLLLLILLATLAGSFLPSWLFMWALAASIFFGFKWITLRRALESATRQPMFRMVSYLFGWPGMDARGFLCNSRQEPISSRRKREWLWPLLKILLGVLLLLLAMNFVALHFLLRSCLG